MRFCSPSRLLDCYIALPPHPERRAEQPLEKDNAVFRAQHQCWSHCTQENCCNLSILVELDVNTSWSIVGLIDFKWTNIIVQRYIADSAFGKKKI